MKVMRVAGKGILLAAVILAVTLSGCGKKGPPVAPRQLPVPAVTDLQHQIAGDQVTLTWSLPPSGGGATLEVEGFYINRYKSRLADTQCTDCPVLFERVARISVKPPPAGEAENPTLTYTEPVDKAHRYVYTVTVFTPSGMEGQASNWVEFIH